MTTFLAAVFVFGLLIFFHELGHFLAAKSAGIKVFEFAIGFGPRLAAVTKGETTYSLRAFPLGGFVRFAGLDPKEEEVEQGRSFKDKSVLQRIGVIFAGPFMNFFLAALLLLAVFMVEGVPMPTTTVRDVVPNRPAAEAGIVKGDRIIAVNGHRIDEWKTLVAQIDANAGREMTITVERKGERFDVRLIPEEMEGKGKIGIYPTFENRQVGLIQSAVAGAQWTGRLLVMIVGFLGQMIFQQAPVDVGGPVRIVSEIGTVATQGFIALLQMAAFLSINIGLFNLLPIPALDGSRILFLLWEGLTGRPINPEKESFIHLVGFGLLLALMVVVTYKDIVELF
ncbi:MAG: RIP metalloprotease RseP [Bacillota bacterium]